MKSRISKIFLFLSGVLLLAGCEKGENIFNMFEDVTVTLHENSAYSVTGYKEVNDGDSIHIDFTINSANKDMYEVWLFESGLESPTLKIPITDESKRREFSSIIKLKANTRAGKTTYRVFPVDKDLVYMGDGHKQIVIDVKPNFRFLTEKHLFLPDSQKVNKCFGSLSTGETFSYSQGKANEAKIDFGIDTAWVVISQTPTTVVKELKYHMFSPDAANLPLFPFYDLSGWNKRTTLFSVPITSNAAKAFTDLKLASQIIAGAQKAKTEQKGPFTFASGSLIYFKTQEGKFGALYIKAMANSYSLGTYVEYQVKIPD